jgi:hypothetical protein
MRLACEYITQPIRVMAGLVPAIHALPRSTKDVDARHKPGHDGLYKCRTAFRRRVGLLD